MYQSGGRRSQNHPGTAMPSASSFKIPTNRLQPIVGADIVSVFTAEVLCACGLLRRHVLLSATVRNERKSGLASLTTADCCVALLPRRWKVSYDMTSCFNAGAVLTPKKSSDLNPYRIKTPFHVSYTGERTLAWSSAPFTQQEIR